MIIARKLDKLCARDLPGHVASTLARQHSVATPVENQGGHPDRSPARRSGAASILPEFLTAAGTFLTALVALISVGVIILRESPHIAWTYLVLIVWILDVAMQIIGGALARMRA